MIGATERERARKITISLPASILTMIDQMAKEQATSRSAVIAQVMEKLAQQRFETELEEAYAENAQEGQLIAEEFLPVMEETWRQG